MTDERALFFLDGVAIDARHRLLEGSVANELTGVIVASGRTDDSLGVVGGFEQGNIHIGAVIPADKHLPVRTPMQICARRSMVRSMADPARVLCVGNTTSKTPLEDALGESSIRLERASDTETALARVAENGIDGIVAGPGGDPLAVFRAVRDRFDSLPVVVVTDDERTATEALNAGATDVALPESALLQARIERAIEPYRAAPRTRIERRFERLLEATRDLVAAEDAEAVARTAVTAVRRVLGLTHTGIHLVSEDGDSLEPVAYTDVAEASLGTVPTLKSGESLAWEAFESGEDRVYDTVHEAENAHNPETHLRSEMIFPLGDHGVMLVASADSHEFDDTDVYFARLLAAATTAALGRATREAALEHKNAQLEEFVSVVSHDLRNPLSVAEGHLALARQTDDLSHLDRIGQSHARMRDIIDDLLVLAREGRAVGTTQPVLIGAVAREAWEGVDTPEATLDTGDDRTIPADRNRLRQLFENTFRNSVEHADPAVTVTVGACDRGFAIADDGPGIPPEEREAVFEPGYTDSEDNTGFGMAIIETIAEGHGWRCEIGESEDGGVRLVIVTDEHQGSNAG